MSPSERSAAAAQQDDDDILEKPPSHPVATLLLIVGAVALLISIGLQASELGLYRNAWVREKTDDYKTTAVEWADSLDMEGSPTPPARRERHAEAPSEEAPAEEAPAEEAPAEEAPAEGAPAEGEGE